MAADDWVKWVKGLSRRREVLVIARTLGISRREAAACCMEVWEWADVETTDGRIAGAKTEDVDTLLGVPGFASAMQAPDVDWLRVNCAGIFLPKFTHHNGKSAKRRAMDSRKKKRHRDLGKNKTSRKCPVGDGINCGIDKRRQEETRGENQLLMSNRKAIGSSTSPPDRLPQLPKNADAEGTESYDLSGIDWSAVGAIAESVGRKIPAITAKDRRNWLRFGVMVQLWFSEDWLIDSVEAVVLAKITKRTKQAHLYGVLKAKAVELGQGDVFRSAMRKIDIPRDVWNSDVLGGPRR